ncbi:TonB-dependent receptor [Roseivirga pacifica]|uniref:TonB-dependent receptor n=1 Tax=Roseivirga pacifica TaxID=1267423 RepID=UPI003BAFA461
MANRLTCLIFASILLPFMASSQSVTFYSSEDNINIPGVAVQISTVKGKTIKSGITDASGQFSLNGVDFPAVLKTQHLSFSPIIDTLYQRTDYRFALTPTITDLDEVVVTGQFSPQSVKNSVFRVQTINAEQIERRGAITLQEALQSQLNIRLSNDLAIGSTTVSLQGISSQNVKILIDGVPLVNRNGNGNGADLSQINLQQIERIEIVEGPMAVNYGANALAGVINLITKKEFKNRTEISANLQSETAGDEIGPDAGRHIQSVGINHRISDRWSAMVSGLHNDFQGYQGSATGRTYEWNPKDQWTGTGLLKYDTENFSAFYRIDALSELIESFGRQQDNYTNEGEYQPFAIDEEYKSKRFSHQVQAEGKTNFLDRYNLFASFSDFERKSSQFANNLVTDERTLTTGEGDQDTSTYQVWELGGAGYLKPVDNLSLQLGYQVSLESVGGGRIADGDQSNEEYAVYTSAEWELNRFTLRPGLRYTVNNNYGNQLLPAMQLKYGLGENANVRFSYGRGFRSPSVRELYFEFVDSNHRIFGNPDLQPEKSNHFGVNFINQYKLSGQNVSSDLNFFFNDITDQISIAQDPANVSNTTYVNINRYKTLGGTLSQKATFNKLSVSLGLSYIGRYNQINEEASDLDEYFFSPEVSSNISYQFTKLNTSVNLFYKYTGVLQSYFATTNDQGEETISIGEIEGYSWLDATVTKGIGQHFELMLGARNVFNIQRVNNSGISGGAHSGGSSVPIAFGRSYFVKLSYNLNLK